MLTQEYTFDAKTGNSPLDLLVVAELDEIKNAETELAEAVSRLSTEPKDQASVLWIDSLLMNVRERAQRLDRMLDAMACA